MRALSKLTWVQAKLYLREPIATFFTLAFAPLVLILFGFIYGNKPVPELGGRGTIDVSVPAYMALIIGTVGLMSVPIGTAAARERGILRRFRATPLRPLTYLLADVLVYFVMTVLGIALLVLVGELVYQVRFDGNPLSLLAAIALGSASFLALGYLLASLAPTARLAQVVGMVLLYPMMFISGATIPSEILPEGVRNVARFLPLTYVVELAKGMWFGDPWSQYLTEVVVLLGVLVVSGAVSAWLFRWE